MIVYNLSCENGHEFEAWFASGAAFDEQAAGGLLVCPVCESRHVEKAVMAPALSGARKPSLNASEISKMRTMMANLRKEVLEKGENVGERFPEEARAMHYGDKETRQIYGQASWQDATDLAEEGIAVLPLPPDPDEAVN